MPDPGHWEVVVPKITKIWRTCILPELMFRWYTRKQHMPNVPSTDPIFVIADSCLMNAHLTAVITTVGSRNFTSLV